MTIETPKKCGTCNLFSDSGNFCAHITPKELLDLNRHSRTATLKRGDSFTDEALAQWPIVAVSSGVLSIQHLLEDGRKSIAALFMRGDIIDMRGSSHRNRGNLISLASSDVCRLSPQVFEKIVETNPRAQKVVWENLRNQTYRAIDHSVDLSKKQALEKLASFIFECRHHTHPSKEDSFVHIPIRRVDLAEYIGMQPETVSRCFKELEERGIIELPKLSELIINNAPALRRIANGDKEAEHSTQNMKILKFG